MALIDRLESIDDTRIAAHTFSALMRLWSSGDITRQDVIDGLNLNSTDEVQLDKLASYYGTLSDLDKAAFHSRVESSIVLLQEKIIDKAKAISLLGMDL